MVTFHEFHQHIVALVVTNLLFETAFLNLLEPYDCVMANRGSKKKMIY